MSPSLDKKPENIELKRVYNGSSSTGSSSSNSKRRPSQSSNNSIEIGSISQPHSKPDGGSFFDSIKDSFRRKDPYSSEVLIDPESQIESTDESNNSISRRHVIMITLGGGLGTGLLVGTGKALSTGGAGGLIVGYAVVCVMLICTMIAAGVLAVSYSSVPGGFNAYCAKLVDPSLGFAVAWNYTINWLTVLPLEMVTASMTIKYWNPNINSDIFIAVFFPIVVVINLFGSRGYAEAEFYLNFLKVFMLVGFILVGILIDSGAVGNAGYIGFKNLQENSMFPNGFKGVCSVFVTASFSFGGVEFMALTAADQKNPRQAIPSAIKHVVYRMLIVYFLSLFFVCLLVPYNSSQLMGSSSHEGAPVSPYVIAVSSHGVRIIPHMINTVILCAVLSVGNAALYSSSRTFYSLAQQGFAPKWFDYIDRNNRPIRAMLVSILIGFFSFIAAYKNQESIFTWLLSLSGLAIIFTWLSICISHIRYLRALKVQGVGTETLGFNSGSIYTSALAAAIILGIFLAQFWVSLFPFNNGGKASANSFFQNYMGIVSFFILYTGHKIYLYFKDRDSLVFPFIKAQHVDLVTDRKTFDAEVMRLEKETLDDQLKNGPVITRIGKFFC